MKYSNDPLVALRFRVEVSKAGDELLLDRGELAMLLGMGPEGIGNAVSSGRLPPPVHITGGKKGLPRWRLGDIRKIGERDSAT